MEEVDDFADVEAAIVEVSIGEKQVDYWLIESDNGWLTDILITLSPVTPCKVSKPITIHEIAA